MRARARESRNLRSEDCRPKENGNVNTRRKTSSRLGDYFDLSILSLSHSFSDGFTSLLAPVLVLILAEFDLSAFDAGVLLSVSGMATFLLVFPISIGADLSGRRTEILVVGLTLASGAYLSMLYTGTFAFLVLLAFVAQAGNAVFHPCGTALVTERFRARKAVAISVFAMAGNIGTTGFPLVQGIAAELVGWRFSVAMFAVPMAVLLPLIRFRYRSGALDRRQHSQSSLLRQSLDLTRAVFNNKSVLALGSVYALTSMASRTSKGFLPVLAAQRFSMNAAAIGLTISVYYGVGIASKGLAAIMYRRLGARAALRVLLVLSLLGTVGFLVVARPVWLIIVAGVAGLAHSVSPIILVATSDSSDRTILTSSVGLIYWMHSIGFVGPFFGGVIASQLGLPFTYIFGATLFFLAVCTTQLIRRGR